MSTATLSFRAPVEFAEQTKALAQAFNMSSSDYVREAVREKNERALKERMVFLSRRLSETHLAENLAMDAGIGDHLQSAANGRQGAGGTLTHPHETR